MSTTLENAVQRVRGRASRPRPPLSRVFRNKFVAGLVVVIPIVITVKSLWWLFSYVDGLAQPLAVAVIGRPVPGLGFVTTVAIVFLAGLLFSTGPLKRLLQLLQRRVWQACKVLRLIDQHLRLILQRCDLVIDLLERASGCQNVLSVIVGIKHN